MPFQDAREARTRVRGVPWIAGGDTHWPNIEHVPTRVQQGIAAKAWGLTQAEQVFASFEPPWITKSSAKVR